MCHFASFFVVLQHSTARHKRRQQNIKFQNFSRCLSQPINPFYSKSRLIKRKRSVSNGVASWKSLEFQAQLFTKAQNACPIICSNVCARMASLWPVNGRVQHTLNSASAHAAASEWRGGVAQFSNEADVTRMCRGIAFVTRIATPIKSAVIRAGEILSCTTLTVSFSERFSNRPLTD